MRDLETAQLASIRGGTTGVTEWCEGAMLMAADRAGPRGGGAFYGTMAGLVGGTLAAVKSRTASGIIGRTVGGAVAGGVLGHVAGPPIARSAIYHFSNDCASSR